MLLIGNAVLLGIGYAQEAPSTTPLPAWKPQPKMMRFLASLTRFSGYAIQPPRGYAMQQTQRAGFAACGWKGTGARNSVVPGLMLTIGQIPLRDGKKMTPEQLLTASLNAQKRRYNDWTQTDFERGQINGLTFARAYWTATEIQKSRKLRGVSYFAVDGNAAILLTGQAPTPEVAKTPGLSPNAGEEADPNSDDSTPPEIDRLQLVETAMYTLHRSGGYKAPVRPISSAP